MSERDRWRFPWSRETPTPEAEFYSEAWNAYQAWHIREGRNRSIIDFDLTTSHPVVRQLAELTDDAPTRAERSRIVDMLTSLNERAREVPVDAVRHQHNWEFSLAQLEASLWFARRLRGDKLDPLEYIEKTMGVRPEQIPQQTLLEQKTIVNDLLRELGVLVPSQESLNGLRKDHQINPDVAQLRLKTNSQQAIMRLNAFLGKTTLVDFQVMPENVDEYWWVWATTDPRTQQFILKQNFSERQGRIWTPGKTEELGWHEGGQHLSRMAIRKGQVQEGKLSSFFGLTTVHGPEQIVEEGLAQTLVLFVPDAYQDLSLEGKLQVRASILRQMVYGNVHVVVNTSPDYDLTEITDYVQSYLPWETASDIERQVNWRTKVPIYQTYLWAYAEGAKRHLQYAGQLSQRGKRIFLQNIFCRPYTPRQEEVLVDFLLRDPRNRAIQP